MSYTYLDFLADLGVGGAHPGGLKLTKELLSNEQINRNTKILDAGCGTGQTSAYIAEIFNCHVTALDNNEIMLKKAKERFSNLNVAIQTQYGSIEKLPFPNDIFDFIVSESVIAFTNAEVSLPELKRVLKQNGKLIAIEMVLEQAFPTDELLELTSFYGVSPLFTEETWINLFQEAGFKQVVVQECKQNFDPNDELDAPDFSLSNHLNEKYMEMLQQHEYLIKKYKGILGFRVFHCSIQGEEVH